jgi:hypothetical protein
MRGKPALFCPRQRPGRVRPVGRKGCNLSNRQTVANRKRCKHQRTAVTRPRQGLALAKAAQHGIDALCNGCTVLRSRKAMGPAPRLQRTIGGRAALEDLIKNLGRRSKPRARCHPDMG